MVRAEIISEHPPARSGDDATATSTFLHELHLDHGLSEMEAHHDRTPSPNLHVQSNQFDRDRDLYLTLGTQFDAFKSSGLTLLKQLEKSDAVESKQKELETLYDLAVGIDLHARDQDAAKRETSCPEAQALLKKALPLLKEFAPDDKQSLFWFQHELGFSFLMQGHNSEASEMLNKAATLAESVFGKTDPQVVDCLIGRAESEFALGHHKDAVDAYEKAFKIIKPNGLPDQLDNVPDLARYEQALRNIGRDKDANDVYNAIQQIEKSSQSPSAPEKRPHIERQRQRIYRA